LFIVIVASPLSAEWLRVDTARFRVIFEPDDAATAAEVLAIADSVYDRVTSYLDYAPRERIPIVIYGNTARANGFFTPYPPHIAMYVAAPTGPWLGARTESWIEALFVHELTHYVHLTRPIGLFGGLKPVLGPLIPSASVLFMPGWAIEGPTVNAETIYTGGGRGRNAFFEMGWVAPILADEFYTYDQAGSGSAYPPAGRIYSAGYLMVDHLYREYGPEAFQELNREFQRWPVLGMRRALRRTTGLRASRYFASLHDALREEYAPRTALPAGDPLSPQEDVGDWHLLRATERGVYAYVRTLRDPGALYRLPWDGSPPERILSLSPLDDYSVGISPDGRYAVAALDAIDYAGAGATTGFSDLFYIDLETGQTRRLTRERRLYHPRIGPARRIYAIERIDSFSRLVEIDAETGVITERYRPVHATLYAPTLSAGGDLLALAKNDRGAQDIVVLDTVRFETQFLVGALDDDAEYYPHFVDREGTRELWFGSDRDGRLALYRATLPGPEAREGSVPPRITGEFLLEDRVGAFTGVAAPEGRVVYGSYRSGGYTIRLGDLRTGDPPSRREPPYTPAIAATPVRAAEPIDDPAAILRRAKPYRDIPRPVLWLPLASLTTGSDEDTVWRFGATALAASNLERHQLAVTAYYAPTPQFFDGEFSYTYTPGAATLGLALAQVHEGDQEPERTATLSISRPVWVARERNAYRGIVGLLGARYRSIGDSPTVDELSYLGSVRVFSRQFGAPRDVFGGPGLDLSVSAALRPPLLDVPNYGTATLGEIEVQRRFTATTTPQFRANLAITADNDGDALDLLPYRAGRFTTREDQDLQSATGAALGRFELLLPLGAYDGAARGIAFQRLGTSLYGEQEWGVADATRRNGDSAAYEPGGFTVAGADLVTDMAFNAIPVRLRTGVALRFSHRQGYTGYRAYLLVENIGGMTVENPVPYRDYFQNQ